MTLAVDRARRRPEQDRFRTERSRCRESVS